MGIKGSDFVDAKQEINHVSRCVEKREKSVH
jgi:hypothetical protein